MNLAHDSGIDNLLWVRSAENYYVAQIYQKKGLIERKTWGRKTAFIAYEGTITKR